MDENQLEKLGSKMRDAYGTVASETALPAEAAPKRPSRRLRKNRSFARPQRRGAASARGTSMGNLVSQHPVASILIALGVGYVAARL